MVPIRTILIEEQDRFARGTNPRAQPRPLQFHQGHEAVHFGLGRRKSSEHPAQAERFVAQSLTQPIVA